MSSLNLYLFGLLNPRRYCLLIVLFCVVVICFSVTWPLVYPWLGLFIVLSMILVVDCLFLGEDAFKYDPDFKNWARASEPSNYLNDFISLNLAGVGFVMIISPLSGGSRNNKLRVKSKANRVDVDMKNHYWNTFAEVAYTAPLSRKNPDWEHHYILNVHLYYVHLSIFMG